MTKHSERLNVRFTRKQRTFIRSNAKFLVLPENSKSKNNDAEFVRRCVDYIMNDLDAHDRVMGLQL